MHEDIGLSGDTIDGMKHSAMQDTPGDNKKRDSISIPLNGLEADDSEKKVWDDQRKVKKARKEEKGILAEGMHEENSIKSVDMGTYRKINKRKRKPADNDNNIISLRKIDDKESSVGFLRESILECLYGTPEKRSMYSNLKVTNVQSVKKVIVMFVPGLQSEDLGLEPYTSFRGVGPFEVEGSQLFPNDSLGQNAKAFPINAPGSRNSLYPAYNHFLNRNLTRKERETRERELKHKKITINDLLMSFNDLVEKCCPLHPSLTGNSARELNIDGERYVDTRMFDHEGSHIFAIDCEMCLSTDERVLTRVSVVDFDGNVVYDQLVKPSQPITDYLTKYSGVTREKLAGVTTTLQDVQRDILNLISESDILIGHSLESDLHALRIRHPKIVDTSVIYEHHAGPPFRPSLKNLASTYLDHEIQVGEHDPMEDAKSSLDLVKLKILHGLTFGVSTRTSNILHELSNDGIKCLDVGNDVFLMRNVPAIDFDGEMFKQLIDNINENKLLIARLRGLALSRGYTYGISGKRRKKEQEEEEEEVPSPNVSLDVLSGGLNELYEKSPQGTMIVVVSGNGDTRPYSKILEELECIHDKQRRKEVKKRRSTDLEDAVSKARDGVAVCLFKQYIQDN